jgi:hypothetical protein
MVFLFDCSKIVCVCVCVYVCVCVVTTDVSRTSAIVYECIYDYCYVLCHL